MNPAELLPHAPPARMLAAITACDAAQLHGLARIDPWHPLASDGTVPVEAAIEIAAQAAACHGVLTGVNGDRGRARGYLVGVQVFERMATALGAGTEYAILVTWRGGSGPLGKWSFVLRAGAAELARGSISTMRG